MNIITTKTMEDPVEILIAEDSSTQAAQLRHMLEEHGYHLSAVQNGREALAAIEQRRPTLVISDIVMPEMDGYELCRRIKQDEKLKRIPVILLTSLSDPVDVLRGLESGADSFIFKPYDQQYLLARITFTLANRNLREGDRAQMGVEISFRGRKFFITSERLQVLNLLLSTYETAVQKNQQLIETQDELRKLNEHLEEKVRERTAALEAEIVERKQAQEELQKSERRYRELFESNPHPMWVYDRQTLAFLAINDAAIQHYGYSREEFLAMTIKEIRPAEEVPALLEHLAKDLRNLQQITWKHRKKNGTIINVEVTSHDLVFDGRPARLSLAYDTTERDKAQEQIREQAALLDKGQDAIMVRDLDDRIQYWNRSAERMYGWSGSEALGKCAGELLSEEILAPLMQQLMERGEWAGELHQKSREGKPIVVESRWTLLRDGAGNPKAKLVANTDITEKKRLEAQFLRAQRMEGIGALAGGIAHDLNNALLPIMLGVEALRTEMLPAHRERMLNTMKGSVKHGAEMIKQILAFARGVAGEPSALDIKHVITEIVRLAKETFPRSIQVRSRVAADVCHVNGNPTQLYQVLLNLCVNARDAMAGGGTLHLNADNVMLDGKITSWKPEPVSGPHVVLTVSDTGSGMSPEVMSRLFEPFFTTKEIGKGTGLGLPTVQGIVKSHGGFMEVTSEVGKGTAFNIYLPAAAATETRPAEALKDLPLGHGEQILIVDDESSILDITREMLEAHHYRVLSAKDGAEAVTLFRQHQGKIRVAIIDMMMPIMDGPMTIQVLQRIDPAVKIIGVSGLGSRSALTEAGKLQVRAFLEKPYTVDALLTTLHQVLVDNGGEE